MSKIGILGKILNGSTIPKEQGKYPAYGGNGIIKYVDKYNYNENTIIIGRVGANCGSVYISREKCWVTDNSLAFIVNDDYDADYVYYLLKMLNLNQFHIGSSQPLITQSIISNIDYNFELNKAIQCKISKKLMTIDEAISINEKLIENIEKYSTSLFDRWFMNFKIPDKYLNDKLELVWNDKMNKNIPSTWKIKKLKDVVSKEKNAIVDGPFGTQMKIEEYVSDGVPVYEMGYLNGRFISNTINNYITKDKYDKIKRSSVKNGDIIISKTGTLGLLGIVKDEVHENGIIVSRLAKITPDPKIIGKYALLIYLKKLNDSGYWMKKSSGSTMPILNNELIGDVEIIIPDNDLYNIFENHVSPLYDKMYSLQKINDKLEEYKQLILPLFINNKLKIEE